MGERAALPARAELLHEGERARVSRLFLSGRTVIRKEPLGPEGQRRLQHELAFLERMRGVVGVAQVLDEPRYPGSISWRTAAKRAWHRWSSHSRWMI